MEAPNRTSFNGLLDEYLDGKAGSNPLYCAINNAEDQELPQIQDIISQKFKELQEPGQSKESISKKSRIPFVGKLLRSSAQKLETQDIDKSNKLTKLTEINEMFVKRCECKNKQLVDKLQEIKKGYKNVPDFKSILTEQYWPWLGGEEYAKKHKINMTEEISDTFVEGFLTQLAQRTNPLHPAPLTKDMEKVIEWLYGAVSEHLKSPDERQALTLEKQAQEKRQDEILAQKQQQQKAELAKKQEAAQKKQIGGKKIQTTSPASTDIRGMGIKNHNELKKFIGKPIQLYVTRYADESYDDDQRDYHNSILNQFCGGILESVSDSTIGSRSRHAITLNNSEFPGPKGRHTFYLSDSELAECNRNF